MLETDPQSSLRAQINDLCTRTLASGQDPDNPDVATARYILTCLEAADRKHAARDSWGW